jgi:hypothetical protein
VSLAHDVSLLLIILAWRPEPLGAILAFNWQFSLLANVHSNDSLHLLRCDAGKLASASMLAELLVQIPAAGV